MTRIIGVVSGKGGVGKSTIVSNLLYGLSELGQDVIGIDSNLTTPHLGLHFGLHLAPKTLHDVLRDEEKISNVMYPHPYGFKIIPASMNVSALRDVNPEKLSNVVSSLEGRTDIVLLDCAPGLGREAVSGIQAANEILLVTNPDLPSVADALKTLKLSESLNKKVIGVVVNRVRKKSHELSREDIESMLEVPVLAEIPEDEKVPESIAAKKPIVDYNPGSNAAIGIRKLSYFLVNGEIYEEPEGFFSRMFRWFTG